MDSNNSMQLPLAQILLRFNLRDAYLSGTFFSCFLLVTENSLQTTINIHGTGRKMGLSFCSLFKGAISHDLRILKSLN